MGSSSHLKVLGLIEVVYGAIHVILFLALGTMSLLGCSICANSESLADGVAAGAFWTAFWGILGIGGAIIACIPVLAGLALANGRGWAKVATIVFAALMIFEFPLGTIFAVYAFWAILVDKPRYSY